MIPYRPDPGVRLQELKDDLRILSTLRIMSSAWDVPYAEQDRDKFMRKIAGTPIKEVFNSLKYNTLKLSVLQSKTTKAIALSFWFRGQWDQTRYFDLEDDYLTTLAKACQALLDQLKNHKPHPISGYRRMIMNGSLIEKKTSKVKIQCSDGSLLYGRFHECEWKDRLFRVVKVHSSPDELKMEIASEIMRKIENDELSSLSISSPVNLIGSFTFIHDNRSWTISFSESYTLNDVSMWTEAVVDFIKPQTSC